VPLHAPHPTSPGGADSPYLTIGTLARQAEDLSLLLDIQRGAASTSPAMRMEDWRGRKIFLCPDPKIDGAGRTIPELRASILAIGRRFEALGARVELFPDDFCRDAFELWINCLSESAGSTLAQVIGGGQPFVPAKELAFWLAGKPRFTLPTILLCLGEQIGVFRPNRARAGAVVAELRAEFERRLDGGLLILPTQPQPAPKHNWPLLRPADVGYTCLFNLFQGPGTAVPLGRRRGLPLGCQIVAGRGLDALTIAAAQIVAPDPSSGFG
jgi:fatty acid amide hydrolase 2